MEKFHIIKRLNKDCGSNATNRIYLANKSENYDSPNSAEIPKTIVVKRCSITKRDKDQLDLETQLMKTMNHPNIIKCFDTFSHDGKMFFVLEHAPKGNLYEKNLKEDEIKNITKQVIAGLQYCHDVCSVIHRDIKPENIVRFNNNTVKLIDFGWSCIYDPNNPIKERAGTIIYNSPEMLSGGVHTFKIDVWQLGVLIYELVSDQIPFDGSDYRELTKRIIKCKPRYPYYFSKDCVNLLKNILVKDPNKRYSLNQISIHPWLSGRN